MKVRIKFSKYSVVKFIGHLDVMRYFQKANRRAGLDMTYSAGFNPHQIMSFAAPLGVGLTSDGEYVDIEVNSMVSKEAIMNALNEQMNEGFLVTGVELVREPKQNEKHETAMSLVAAADYMISLKDGYTMTSNKDGVETVLSKEEIEEAFKNFMGQEAITILKKTKKSEREMNIKPFIFEYGFSCPTGVEHGIEHADVYENGIRFFLQLATGSVINIKPELVMEAFCQYIGVEFNEFAFQMHRMETYGNVAKTGMSQEEMIEAVNAGKEIERKLVPLGLVGIIEE